MKPRISRHVTRSQPFSAKASHRPNLPVHTSIDEFNECDELFLFNSRIPLSGDCNSYVHT